MKDDRLAVVPRAAKAANDVINSVFEGRDGSLWAGRWNGGLSRLKGGVLRVYGPKDGLTQTEVFSLTEDRWGSIWIGTRKGLFVLPGEAAGGGPIQVKTKGAFLSLMRDREATIWAGTLGSLRQYKDWRLSVYNEDQGLPDRNVASVVAARAGGLWVSMNGGGLARFRDGKVVAKYGRTDGLPSDDATAVCEARDGTVWVGTWGEGLHRFKDGRFTPVPIGKTLNAGIVRSIHEDHAGDIWVGTWGKGVLRFHGDTVTTFTARNGLVDNQVRVIEEDRAGSVWVATSGGLSQFRDGRWKTYTSRDGLSEDSILSLRGADDGSLWIGTWGSGLNRLRQGRVTAYTTRDGLPCDTICSIVDDGDGNLWVGSIRGIFRVRKADLDAFDRGSARSIRSSSYDTDDGMKSAQCNRENQPAACQTADGRLWFATINGMVMLDPASLPANRLAPTVILERVLCDGRVVGGVLGSLELPAARREIEFHYTATCLLASEKSRFRYKLDGYNADWVDAGHGREAHFANLPPGVYRFLVSACNGDGVWGPETKLLELAVAPAFFMRPGFRLACGLLVLAAAGMAYRLWTARLRARERELVVLVERRTVEARAAQRAAEQANRAKDRFLAVLSHELRTPLTPVLLSVDCLLDEANAPETREQLEMIRRNVELEARLVDDLLDVSRIERAQLKLELELVDVHLAIVRAVEVCSSEVDNSGLRMELDLRAESHHARADEARLIQVFWNLIRNAVKFAAPAGTLTIRTDNLASNETVDGGRRVVVEFLDTGIGIEPEMLERIFDPFEQGSVELRDRKGGLGLGLAISRAVAQAHGGSLTVSSAGRNQGSTFRLELAAVAAPQTSPAPAPRPALPRQRPAGLKILVVEDNVDTLRYLDVVLKKQSHQVTAASSLAAARAAAAAGAFDLLISDIELPDGTGLDLIRELAPRGIRGIALSGYGSEDDVRNSREAGFALHLVKPILADLLNDAVCRLANNNGARPQVARSDSGKHLTESAVNDQSDRLSSLTLEPR